MPTSGREVPGYRDDHLLVVENADSETDNTNVADLIGRSNELNMSKTKPGTGPVSRGISAYDNYGSAAKSANRSASSCLDKPVMADFNSPCGAQRINMNMTQ